MAFREVIFAYGFNVYQRSAHFDNNRRFLAFAFSLGEKLTASFLHVHAN